jgi:hypothetical protein
MDKAKGGQLGRFAICNLCMATSTHSHLCMFVCGCRERERGIDGEIERDNKGVCHESTTPR